MPRALPIPMREHTVSRYQKGESLAQIAESLDLSYWTVRKIWRRYRDGGWDNLVPAYSQCGQRQHRSSQRVYRAAIWLKRQHPTWGGKVIRMVIQQKWKTEKVPHERTLQRWFRKAGINKSPRSKRIQPQVQRGQNVHDVWEMDAKEQIPLRSGERISWLLISDEASGAILSGTVFPPGSMDKSRPASSSPRSTQLF